MHFVAESQTLTSQTISCSTFPFSLLKMGVQISGVFHRECVNLLKLLILSPKIRDENSGEKLHDSEKI